MNGAYMDALYVVLVKVDNDATEIEPVNTN